MSAAPLAMPTARRVMIVAGGTGGHVYPALAVAKWLREQRHEVSWLGTQAGIEARIVPAAGFPIDWLQVTGLRGKSLTTWLAAPVRLLRALSQALRAIRERQPDVVLGMGGFVTGPGGVAAWLTRRPLLLHEQNAIPGLSNRLLARVATQVFEAFPASFSPARGAQLIGNPVREDIEAIATQAREVSTPPRLLVLGGSLGARTLNLMLPAALAKLDAAVRPDVRHQTGQRGYQDARQAYEVCKVDGELAPFIEDMASAYAWADLVVCRAGALTIAELAAAGVGAVLVPYPHAVDDHQTHNGRAMVDAGAALMIRDQDVEAASLARLLGELLGDSSRLRVMAQRAATLAYPGAARALATACLDAANAYRGRRA